MLLPVVALLIASVVPAEAEAIGNVAVTPESIVISGEGQNVKLPCENRNVVVAGLNHTVTLEGTCASLEVSGMNHKVEATIAPGGVLDVAGVEHKVRWRSNGEIQRSVSGLNQEVVKLR